MSNNTGSDGMPWAWASASVSTSSDSSLSSDGTGSRSSDASHGSTLSRRGGASARRTRPSSVDRVPPSPAGTSSAFQCCQRRCCCCKPSVDHQLLWRCVRHLWWGVLVASFVLAGVVWGLALAAEKRRVNNTIASECAQRFAGAERAVASVLTLSSGYVALLGSQQKWEITNRVFKEFVNRVASEGDTPVVRALWLMRVLPTDRAEFERRVGGEVGIANYRIKDVNGGVSVDERTHVIRTNQSVYYPVTYMAGYANDTLDGKSIRPIYGVDALSFVPHVGAHGVLTNYVEFFRAIVDAAESRALVPGSPTPPTIVRLYLPVFNVTDATHLDADRRHSQCLGVLLIVIDPRYVFDQALAAFAQNTDLWFSLTDGPLNQTAAEASELYTLNRARLTGAAAASAVVKRDILFGARTWTMTCTPTDAYYAARVTPAPVAYGIGVFSLGALLTFVLRRVARVSELAAQLASAAQRTAHSLSFVCHELQSPLHAVAGMNALVLESDLAQDQLECAQSIAFSVSLMSEIVRDVLDLSKIQAGTLELHLTTFDVHGLVQELHGEYRRRHIGVPIAWSATVSPEVPVWVVADRVRLRQMLTHCIANAFKFTPSGRIGLTVNRLLATGEQQLTPQRRARLEFAVADTGIGIAPDLLPTLFTPYARAHRLGDAGGTGLGLSIVKSLARAMGGDVRCQSTVGQGSVFTLSLPVALPRSVAGGGGAFAAGAGSAADVSVGITGASLPGNEEDGLYRIKETAAEAKRARVIGRDRRASTAPTAADGDDSKSGGSALDTHQPLHELRRQGAPQLSSPTMPTAASVPGGDAADANAGTVAAGSPPPSSPTPRSSDTGSSGCVTGGPSGATSFVASSVSFPPAAAIAASPLSLMSPPPHTDATMTPIVTPTPSITTMTSSTWTPASPPPLVPLQSPAVSLPSTSSPLLRSDSKHRAGSGDAGVTCTTVVEVGGSSSPLSLGPFADIRILLVEDNAVNRKMGLRALACAGFLAASAVDGIDALEQCGYHAAAAEAVRALPPGKHTSTSVPAHAIVATMAASPVGSGWPDAADKYDVILMDVEMPRQNGIDCTQTLRGLGLRTPIIGLTANAMADQRQRCMDAGMTHFQPKPFAPEELKQLILDVAPIRLVSSSVAASIAGDTAGASGTGVGTGGGMDSSLRADHTTLSEDALHAWRKRLFTAVWRAGKTPKPRAITPQPVA